MAALSFARCTSNNVFAEHVPTHPTFGCSMILKWPGVCRRIIDNHPIAIGGICALDKGIHENLIAVSKMVP